MAGGIKINDLICSPGLAGFFYDDQRAIKKGAKHDGFSYVGSPVTEGFTSIRQAGESVSVMLVLEDGQVAYGDCAAVQYSGAGGRDPLFLARDFIPLIEREMRPLLRGRRLHCFRELAEEVDNLFLKGNRLHTAVRYGVTQALLDAAAKIRRQTMAEVIRDEYDTGLLIKKVPIFAQSGDDRYLNVDKMIIKAVDVLPHGLINNVEEKLGTRGEILKAYVEWLRDRVLRLRTSESYFPVFHIDVYGTVGQIFSNNTEQMAGYLAELGKAAAPFTLRIEGPMDMEEKIAQLKAMLDLRLRLKAMGATVQIVADEWCNTLDDIRMFADAGAADMIQIKTPDLGGVNNIAEAILYCKARGIGAYCGGTCNETDQSARVCTNIAMACGADQCLAKPGMGVDEGYMIVYNEMNRVLALTQYRAMRMSSPGVF